MDRRVIRDPFRFFYHAIILSVVSLLLYLGLDTFLLDDDLGLVLDDLFPVYLNTLATAALFLAFKSTYRYSKKMALPWLFWGLSQLTYLLGDIIWAVLELVYSEPPFPSVADIIYLFYYPFFIIGILTLLTGQQQRNWRTLCQQMLDMSIVLIAATLISWNYVFGPLISSYSDSSLWEQVLAFIYPVADFLLFGTIPLLLFRQMNKTDATAIALVFFSALIMVVSDSYFSIQSLKDTYISGSLVDMGWNTSILLMVLAGSWQYSSASQSVETHTSFFTSSSDNLKNLSIAYPYLWLFAALGLLLHSFFQHMPMDAWMIAAGVIVIIVLVFIRNFFTRLENRQLFIQLESSLKESQQQKQNLEFEIDHRKRLERRLLHETFHDGLTGLPNRVLLLEHLEHAIEYARYHTGQCFSILFIDLDNFSLINDSLGYSLGDQLLVMVSQRLKPNLQSDDMLVRLSGDEFIMLLDQRHEVKDISAIASNIQKQFEKPFFINDQEIHITVSIGIIPNLNDYDNSIDIMRDADIALREAKISGKSNIEVFKPVMRSQALERHSLETYLRHAVEYQEFHLNFQPIISIPDIEITGFEALLRWNNSILGTIPPDRFIPVAEETGLIHSIGKWAMWEASRQLHTWHTQYPDKNYLSMHINISGKQLLHENFINDLKQVLDKIAVNPERIGLEITESVFVKNQSTVLSVLTALCDLGVHLEIDDFGTGYSSLSYLQHIPVDMIKIDRSFIQEISQGEKPVELIATMIHMAKNLKCRTVAEGVETIDQLQLLKKLKCDYVQGYIFSRPVDHWSAEEMIKYGLPKASRQLDSYLKME